MITDKDIQKLSRVLATKEDIKAINARLENVESIVSVHTAILDGLAKNMAIIKDENFVIKKRLGLAK